MNLIDYQDSRPIYEQITENYKTLILKGVLVPGEQMPSVRKLAMELSTNPNTVHRAYMLLEQQGYVQSVKGKGIFVSEINSTFMETKKQEITEKLKALLDEAAETGIDIKELLEGALDDND